MAVSFSSLENVENSLQFVFPTLLKIIIIIFVNIIIKGNTNNLKCI